jgi:hypothetical protein
MKYMHKALWQPDGHLVIRGNSRALLYRAVADLGEEIARREPNPDLQRTLKALQDMLGAYDAPLPTANELLGDAQQQLVARNLLKG